MGQAPSPPHAAQQLEIKVSRDGRGILLIENFEPLSRKYEFRIALTDYLRVGVLERIFSGDAVKPPLMQEPLVVGEV